MMETYLALKKQWPIDLYHERVLESYIMCSYLETVENWGHFLDKFLNIIQRIYIGLLI